jgi:hypothetical protein
MDPDSCIRTGFGMDVGYRKESVVELHARPWWEFNSVGTHLAPLFLSTDFKRYLLLRFRLQH